MRLRLKRSRVGDFFDDFLLHASSERRASDAYIYTSEQVSINNGSTVDLNIPMTDVQLELHESSSSVHEDMA